MIEYLESVNGVTVSQLDGGFFDGWPNPPSTETHLNLLQNSDEIVLALDDSNGKIVGFITAVSDGVLSAYVPFLEVLPAYKGRGIGTALVERLFKKLENLYMIDLICDSNVVPFYERFNMFKSQGLIKRNFNNQSGCQVHFSQ